MTDQQDMFAAIYEVTAWPSSVPAGRVGKLAAALLKAGATPASIRERFGTVDPGNGWWFFRDCWEGRQAAREGRRPNEKNLRELCRMHDTPLAVQPAARSYDALDAFVEAQRGHGN